MNPLDETISEALEALRRVNEIMEREGESNWIRGIRAAIAAGESAGRQNASKEASLAEMASIFRSMCRGPGGFSDYHIWREDFVERQEANKEFCALADRLWTLLGK